MRVDSVFSFLMNTAKLVLKTDYPEVKGDEQAVTLLYLQVRAWHDQDLISATHCVC